MSCFRWGDVVAEADIAYTKEWEAAHLYHYCFFYIFFLLCWFAKAFHCVKDRFCKYPRPEQSPKDANPIEATKVRFKEFRCSITRVLCNLSAVSECREAIDSVISIGFGGFPREC